MSLVLNEPLAMAFDPVTLHKARRVSKHWRDTCRCAWTLLRVLIAELRSHPLAWRIETREPWARSNHMCMHNRNPSVVAVGDVFDGYTVKESGEITPLPNTTHIHHREVINVHWHRRPPTSLYKRLRLWLVTYNTETYGLNMLLDGWFSFVATNDFARPTCIVRQLTFPDSRDPRFVYFVAVPDESYLPLHVCHIDVRRGVGVWTSLPDSMVSYGYVLVRYNKLTLYRDPPRTIEF